MHFPYFKHWGYLHNLQCRYHQYQSQQSCRLFLHLLYHHLSKQASNMVGTKLQKKKPVFVSLDPKDSLNVIVRWQIQCWSGHSVWSWNFKTDEYICTFKPKGGGLFQQTPKFAGPLDDASSQRSNPFKFRFKLKFNHFDLMVKEELF